MTGMKNTAVPFRVYNLGKFLVIFVVVGCIWYYDYFNNHGGARCAQSDGPMYMHGGVLQADMQTRYEVKFIKNQFQKRAARAWGSFDHDHLHGEERGCPCCGWSGNYSEFESFGVRNHGAPNHRKCPTCWNAERQRASCARLADYPFDKKVRALHFGPQGMMSKVMDSMPQVEHIKGDFMAEGYGYQDTMKLDVTDIPFNDNEMEMVLILHVLEHVVDYKTGLSEIYRVMKPGGFLLVEVPCKHKLLFHDSCVGFSPDQKLQQCGQDNHE
eukprot:Awhi_evm1s15793